MKRKKGKFYIYGHYTADTDKLFYIGKGSGNRAWSSKATRAKQNPHWANVVNKHGYVVKLIEEGLAEKKAFEREREIIAEIGLENLTNMTSGGEGFTSEDAQKLAQKNLQNPEWRKKLKEANQKRSQDPEWIRKNKEAVQKRSQNPEWRKWNAEKNRRISQDPEWIRKNKEAGQKRSQNPEWHRKNKEAVQKRSQNPEWRRKVKEARQKRAKHYNGKVISPTGQIHDVHILSEFCRVHNIDVSHMHKVLKGTHNHHKGWKKYIPPTDIHTEFFTF